MKDSIHLHPVDGEPICTACLGNCPPAPQINVSGPQWCHYCDALLRRRDIWQYSMEERVMALRDLEQLVESTKSPLPQEVMALRSDFMFIEPGIGADDQNHVTAMHVDQLLRRLENPVVAEDVTRTVCLPINGIPTIEVDIQLTKTNGRWSAKVTDVRDVSLPF